MLISKIASDNILNTAFEWVNERRQDYSANRDIWDLRIRWPEIRPHLQAQMLAGEYVFTPLIEIRLPDGGIEKRALWCAKDSLVLKSMAIVLGEHLDPVLFDRCFHIAGRGGAKAAVREVCANLCPDRFVMKSDVKSYYANIDHRILYDLLEQQISDPAVMRLVWQYLNRTVCYGENYREVTRGISLG